MRRERWGRPAACIQQAQDPEIDTRIGRPQDRCVAVPGAAPAAKAPARQTTEAPQAEIRQMQALPNS